MIYDRPYMQSDYDRHQMSALAWVLGGTIVAFLAQSVVETPWINGGALIARDFALSFDGIARGFVWQWITYGFIHAGGLHVIGNLLGLFFLGRELLPVMGGRRFVGLFLGAIVIGGLLTTVVAAAAKTSGVAVGCSGAVLALLTVFACLTPDRPMTILLFFVVPVTMKPKHMALAALAITAFCFLFLELTHVPMVTPPSHLLGGMLAGWLYFRFVHSRASDLGRAKPAVELPAWLRKRKGGASQGNYKVNVSKPQDIRAEVDRILDKINSQGFGALTEEERRVLDDARDVLNKR